MEKLRISSYVIPIKLEDEINKYMLMHMDIQGLLILLGRRL